jgi:2-polyprenyl-3-methyl-5-hydroxy-6-metoxy-1,4-benzoquinol methylase
MPIIEPTPRARLDRSRIIAEHGDWTAMSIHLGRGIYTREPVADWRLRRIVQIAEDLLGKPLSEARVLDLACLEGQYGIEFALHGAQVVGLEIREANLAKARFAQQELGLDNIRFIQDDVRNLSERVHGTFDIVICSGILYHLDVPDVFDFVQRIYDVSARLVVFDTQLSLSDRASVDYQAKYRDFWASIDNTRSFWLTHASLCNLISEVGFTSFLRVENPHMQGLAADRATYVAVRGRRAKVLSSPPTDALVEERRPEREKAEPNPVQKARGPLFRLLKTKLPQPVKEVLKTGLRAAHLMSPDSTPSFLKDKSKQ